MQLVKNGNNTGYMVTPTATSHNFGPKIETDLKAGVYSLVIRAIADTDTIYKNSDYTKDTGTVKEYTRHAKYIGTSVNPDNKTITLNFDDNLYNNTESLTGLKEKIMIAKNSTTSFVALGVGDNVSIGGKQVTISLNVALDSKTNRVKILKDAIKDNSNTAIGTDIITETFSVGDGTLPVVGIVVADPPVDTTNAPGQKVTVKSTKAGRVYLILSTEAAPNQVAMDISVAENKGVYTTISKADTNTTVNVAGLNPGTYKAIAVDSSGTLSTNSQNILIKDGIAPVITLAAQTVTNAEEQKIEAQINEIGKIILIKSDAYTTNTTAPIKNKPTSDEITKAKGLTPKQAVENSVVSGDVDKKVEISTAGLVPGTYHVFAVDTAGNMTDKATKEITVRDGIAPTVKGNAQERENNSEGIIHAGTNEDGWIYVILDGELVVRAEDLEAATQQNPDTLLKKGAKIAISRLEEGPEYTWGQISSYNLKPGTYKLYAVDNAGNISNPGENNITIKDTTAPRVINTSQKVTNADGQKVTAMSTEGTGYVYIIKSDVVDQATKAHLDATIEAKTGAKAEITKANANMDISTKGLIAGTYYAYAVDGAGNVSVKGTNKIVIEDKE